MTLFHPSNQSPIDVYRDIIEGLVESGSSAGQIADYLKRNHQAQTSERSIRRALRRWEIAPLPTRSKDESPSFSQKGDTVEINTGRVDKLITDEELIEMHGLDTEDWVYNEADVNYWGQPGQENHQLKLRLRRKKALEFIMPAGESSYVAPERKARVNHGQPVLWVLPGDQHAPGHSVAFHEAFLEFLADNKPDEMLLMGDGLDFADISRHRDNPEWTNTAQESLNGYHTLLCDYVSASPDTRRRQLWGNHCLRIRNELLNRAERLYGIKPANDPDARDALDLSRLLHFDSLGIEAIDPDGEYTHAQVQIAPDLIARHGWLTGPNAMNKALSGLTCSIIYGHVHSAGVKYTTRWTPEGEPVHYSAIENGTMCEIRGGMGYAVDVGWTPCFSTIQVWPDGHWNHEFARFVNGKLYWRDECYG